MEEVCGRVHRGGAPRAVQRGVWRVHRGVCGEVCRGAHGGLCGVPSLEGGVKPIIWQSERMWTERGF